MIGQSFQHVPVDYCLSYLDADKDEICLTCDEDLSIMLAGGMKVTKVFIKQSITQTLVIEPEYTEQISVEFEEGSRIREGKGEERVGEGFAKKGERKEQGATIIDLGEGEVKPVGKSEVKEERSVEVVEIPDPKLSEIKVVSDIKPEPETKEKSEFEEELIEEELLEEKPQEESLEERPQEKSLIKEVEIVREVKPLLVERSYKDVGKGDEVPSPQKEVIIPLLVPAEQSRVKPESKEVPIAKSEYADLVDDKPIEIKLADLMPGLLGQPRPSQEKPLVQHEALCTVCKDEYGIIGDRYQCIFCEKFNLCSACEAKSNHPHPLLKVKRPEQAVSRDMLMTRFGKQEERDVKAPFGVQPIPPTHYVPSINKEEAMGFIKEAERSLNDGYERGRRMLQDMFTKLEMNHRSPYEYAQPITLETPEQKAQNLTNLFGINYREALVFVKRFPRKTTEEVTQIYIDHENKKKNEISYPYRPKPYPY